MQFMLISHASEDSFWHSPGKLIQKIEAESDKPAYEAAQKHMKDHPDTYAVSVIKGGVGEVAVVYNPEELLSQD